MTKNKNSTTPATENTEPKRRGRPASFDVPTVAVLTHVPEETREQMRALAEDKGERINQAIARIVAAEFKRLESRRSKRKTRRAAPAQEAQAEQADA